MKSSKSISLILAVLTDCSCGFFAAGCGEEPTKTVSSKEYVVNSYESYADLVKVYAPRTMLGEITLCQEQAYVTDGKASAKFHFITDVKDGDIISSSADTRNVSTITYSAYDYPDEYRYLNKVDYFSVDIYNAEDKEYDLYFGAKSEKTSKFIYTNGARLAAKQWNRIRFDVNPYQFGANSDVIQYDFYFLGMESLPENGATMYVDNFRIGLYDKTPQAPKYVNDSDIFYGGIDVLKFDAQKDMSYVSTSSSAPASRFALCKASYDPAVNVFGTDGALRMDMHPSCLNNKSFWMEESDYNVDVDSTIIKLLNGAKTVSIRCHNPGVDAQNVCLYASYQEGTINESIVEQRVLVGAGETVTITIDDEEILSKMDKLKFGVASWRLTGYSSLYFSGLKFTV